ncbi:hypothetical protein FHS44_000561 [Streptosporangium saharense]|uniref:Uncharacterized protein n=1 Tax=Streptosporangium saharense TaxID=1706840 RepID=A0A7W7QHI4_9ACTN|nr:hypothetical protein [Streptosporangium saharense]
MSRTSANRFPARRAVECGEGVIESWAAEQWPVIKEAALDMGA